METPIEDRLTATLRRIVGEAGYGAQQDLARKMGRSYSTISKWVAGDRMPSLDEYAAMVDWLGYRLDIEVVPKDADTALPRLCAILAAVPEAERERFLSTLEAGVGVRHG